MARPSKFSTQRFGAVVERIAAGMPVEHAARAGGVVAATFRRWLKADPKLREAVKVAEAVAVQRFLGRVEAASEETWQAAAWWLERRHPDEFGSERRQLREMRRQQREVAQRLDEIARQLAEVEQADARRAKAAEVHNRLNGVLN